MKTKIGQIEGLLAALAGKLAAAHAGATGSAHGAVTTSENGFMTAADKTKLDGVSSGANNYAHPSTHAPSVIAQDANNRFVTDTEKADWNARASVTSGSSTFNTTTGVTITHNLGTVNYRVVVTPTSSSSGYLGEYYVVKTANTIVVYCTGSTTTTTFDYAIIKN